MNQQISTIGVDVAKAKFDVALLRAAKYRSKVFPNSPAGHQAFLDWLHQHEAADALICMEATGQYFEPIACFLADRGLRVAVVNPARVAAFAEAELSRTKTDRTDARLIARFAAAQHPQPWQPPAPEVRLLRDLVRRLEDLQALEQQEHNRLETASAPTRASVQAVLATVAEQIEQLKREIRSHIDHHPDLKDRAKLLASIPGVAERTIALLLAEIRFEAFDHPGALTAFVGLNPQLRQSGTSLRGRSTLSKTGSARVRKALYFPALTACRYNPLIKAFYQRLLAAGKTKKQAVCAAMRKLLHIIYGILKSGQPFNPNHGQTA